MLLGIEALARWPIGVGPLEPSTAPAAPAFAALEDDALIDLVHLVELYAVEPP